MEKKLTELKCESCKGNIAKLENNEIQYNLEKLNNWSLNEKNEMIFKKFTFKNFNNALNFTNLVGKLSEEEGHHPDISLGWGYCLIMIHTHKINGLSINDFILASKIDLIKFD